MKILGTLLVAVALLTSASARAADEYPSKTITIVNLYSPGGGLDIVARADRQRRAGPEVSRSLPDAI